MHNLRLFLLSSFLCPAMIFAQAQTTWSPAASASAGSSPAAAAVTPNPTTPAEFFARARQLSSLEAAGIPFHVKATYVASGDTEFTGTGTYEKWWQSKDDWRIEATLGNFRYLAVSDKGKRSVYSTSDYTPLRLRQVLKNVLIQFPPDAEASSAWKLSHQKVAGVDLMVISRNYKCVEKKRDPKRTTCAEQYYFSSQGVLRLQFVNTTETLYNRFQTFDNHLVSSRIDVAAGVAPFLKITVNAFEPLDATEKTSASLTAIPGDLHPVAQIQHDTPGVTRPKILQHVQPVYPLSARQNRMQGTVVISVTVDSNGNVREPYVTQSAGPVLDTAALQAVRQWKYQPLTVNGAGIPLDTNVSVVFALRN